MAKKKRSTRKTAKDRLLELCDAKGRIRIVLSALGDVPIFQMLDAHERPRISMQVGEDGRAYFQLKSADGQGLVNVSAGDQGPVGFSIWGPNGSHVMELGWSSEEGLSIDVGEKTTRIVVGGIELVPRAEQASPPPHAPS